MEQAMSQAARLSPIRIKNCAGGELSTGPARWTDSERALSRLSIDKSPRWASHRRRGALAVVEILNRKQAGMPIKREPEAAPTTNVVNLMDVLRRSIDAEKPARRALAKAPDRKKPANGARKAGRHVPLWAHTLFGCSSSWIEYTL